MKIGYLMQEGGPDVRKVPLTGPANHVLKIFQELQQLGHDVRLLARWDNVIWKSDDLVSYERVRVERCDRGVFRATERLLRGLQARLGLPYLNLFESLRFAEACRQELADRDILYERQGWMGYGAGLYARWAGTPLVLEVNNGDFVTELERLGVAPQGVQRWLAIKLMRAGVGRARFFVAAGDGHRQRFVEFWNASPLKIRTVENGSELVTILQRSELSTFTTAPEDGRPVIIAFVGAFEPWHGILILLSAIRTLAAAGANIRVLLIGSGTLWNDITRFVADHGLQHVVEMTGQLEITQMARRLAASDIGIAPYCGWMEYSGLKLFDYKAAGLAIIASGENGQPAVLEHGRTAWIVPPCDEQSLVAAIQQLAADPALRRRLGQQARLEAERAHSWRSTASQLVAVFENIREAR